MATRKPFTYVLNLTLAASTNQQVATLPISDAPFVAEILTSHFWLSGTPFTPLIEEAGPTAASNTAISINALSMVLSLDDQAMANAAVAPPLIVGTIAQPRILTTPWELQQKASVKCVIDNAHNAIIRGWIAFHGYKLFK